jgi:DNA helicase-2/ATP-dependent DNA helicase PcrA
MQILEGLNPEQRAAVEHIEGPLLVVAGAGTGKTQVITRRIAHLIDQRHAKPTEILALTFTEKAAREMEERLYELIGWESFQVAVMTFHAFGTELMGRYASHAGRAIRGGLLNDTQKALLLQQHLSEISLSYYGPQADVMEFLEGVVAYIGELQNAAITPGDYSEYVAQIEADPGDLHPWDVAEQRDLANLYVLYERIKTETGTFDYNDQLQLPLQILQQRPNLAQRLAKEYRYVLVDEYQDTNRVQDELLRTFIGPTGNLFAVGDDDQAIYGFRGADISNILRFAEHFKVERPAVLVRNYRSGQAILDAAYQLIRHNDPERLEAKLGIVKRLVALHDTSTTQFVPYRSPADEVEGVVSAIERRLASGETPANIAVLSATHAPLRAMAKAMRTRNVPFALSTVTNIFEQPELIGLWYLLRWLSWQASEEAVGHVIMGPFIGWSPERYRKVLEQSREDMVSIEEALRSDDSSDAVELVAALDRWRAWAHELPVSQLAFKLVFETGRAEEWRMQAEHSGRMVRVFEDLQRLLDQMQDFETVAGNPRLVEYVQFYPKPPVLEVSEPVGDLEGVQLLTVHASKGLEFDTVYVVSCTQRSWSGSHGRQRSVPEQLQRAAELPPEHEYRRLMYVAATRARQELIVSAPVQGPGGARQAVTPLVQELFGKEVADLVPVEAASARLEEALRRLQRFYPLQATEPSPRMPFESADGWIELSVTQLGGYEYCPFEFYLQNVLQIKQPMGPQMAFGSALHHAFEAYYKGKLSGAQRNPAELHALLDELWSDRGYESREAADNDRALAHATLDTFLTREERTERTVVASELPIRFEVPEAKLRLKGKIDAIFAQDGGVELRDFKTGRTKTSVEKLEAEAKTNFQLRSYALAYQSLKGELPSQLVLDYVVTGVEGAAGVTAQIMKNHRTKLAALTEKIRAGEFQPNPSPVHNCAAVKYYGTGEQDELLQESLRQAEEVV